MLELPSRFCFLTCLVFDGVLRLFVTLILHLSFYTLDYRSKQRAMI